MNRRNCIADRYSGRLQSGTITVYDSRGETLARFRMKEPPFGEAPPFRRRPLYEQPNKAARIAKGVAVFIVALAVAALLSVDDYEAPAPEPSAGLCDRPLALSKSYHTQAQKKEQEEWNAAVLRWCSTRDLWQHEMR